MATDVHLQNHTQARGVRWATLAVLAVLVIPAGDIAGESVRRQAAREVTKYETSSKAIVGLAAVDLRTGRTIAEHRASESLLPASNQKLLTTAFALASLGNDFEFTTAVYQLGDDVVVIGDGDPTLGDPRLTAKAGTDIYAELDRWSSAVAARLPDGIAGDLLVCSGLAAKAYRNPDWPAKQHHRAYAAPVSGLNFHNNCFGVTFAVAGGRASASVQPQSRFIEIVGSVRPGKKHLWSLKSDATDSSVKLSGTVTKSVSQPRSVAANHPPLLLGRVFADRLARAGVRIGGQIRSVSPDELDLARLQSICRTRTPLSVVIRRANKRSLNMAAECLFLRAGDGTWANSAEKMTRILGEHYGLPAGSITVRDGSGLSRHNRVTAHAMVRLLRSAVERPDAMVLLTSLPRSGEAAGSLRKRLREKDLRGRVLAKTGSLDGVTCLSGYVLDEGNRPAIAFSFLVNRIPAGKKWLAWKLENRLCRLFVQAANSPQSKK